MVCFLSLQEKLKVTADRTVVNSYGEEEAEVLKRQGNEDYKQVGENGALQKFNGFYLHVCIVSKEAVCLQCRAFRRLGGGLPLASEWVGLERIKTLVVRNWYVAPTLPAAYVEAI